MTSLKSRLVGSKSKVIKTIYISILIRELALAFILHSPSSQIFGDINSHHYTEIDLILSVLKNTTSAEYRTALENCFQRNQITMNIQEQFESWSIYQLRVVPGTPLIKIVTLKTFLTFYGITSPVIMKTIIDYGSNNGVCDCLKQIIATLLRCAVMTNMRW